jgi:2'-hydroxyisoflavone reductase
MMNILVIGGTRFIGRTFIEAALERGHLITYFHRGKTGMALFNNAREILGDRDGELDRLGDESWDAVLDTSGYFPRVVGHSARYLAPRTRLYAFISTLSVFADFSLLGMTESSPLATIDDESIEEITNDTYGALKVLCEQVVQDIYAEKALIIRPGLIVGPYDSTDRFTYWVRRCAQGGEILAPKPKQAKVQLIDARDLMQWVLRLMEDEMSGVFNATGPREPLNMIDLLSACMQHASQPSKLKWVAQDFLLNAGIQPWSDLPLWVPDSAFAGMNAINCEKAYRAGLDVRPIANTIEDTLRWDQLREPQTGLSAGLSPEREAQLLRGWSNLSK